MPSLLWRRQREASMATGAPIRDIRMPPGGLPGQRRRRMLQGLFLALLITTLLQYAIIAANDVTVLGRLESLRLEPYAHICWALSYTKTTLAYFVLIVLGLSHSYQASVMARGRKHWPWCLGSGGRKAGRLSAGRPSSHWAAAASRGMFLESVQHLAVCHTRVVAVFASLTLLTTASIVLGLILVGVDAVMASNPLNMAHVTSVCGQQWNSCRVGAIAPFVLLQLTAGLQLTLMVMLVFIPIRFWSPVTVEAVRQTGSERLRRCLAHLVPVSLLLCLWSLHLLLLEILYSTTGIGAWGPAYFYYQLFSGSALAVVQVLCLCWCCGARLPWRQAAVRATPHGRGPWRVAPIALSLSTAGTNGRAYGVSADPMTPPTRSRPGEGGGEDPEAPGSDQPNKPITMAERVLLYLRNFAISGRRYNRDLILFASIFLWSYPELEEEDVNTLRVVVAWVFRVPFLFMMLFNSDCEATFEELEREGAAFGLVVDAKALSDALEAWLSGATAAPWQRRNVLQKYKASMFRMRDTLAVSYRWQPAEVEIVPGVHLNMSRWQMQTLAAAIRKSSVAYVWLDKLSLPQHSHKALQQRLLSRMLAVYSSAGVTLAMRSKEPDGSRYHQRGWTMQEYCSATRLAEADEPALGASAFDVVRPDETDLLTGLRLWCQTRVSDCRPYWLYGGVEAALDSGVALGELHDCFSKYMQVSSVVQTQLRADHIRALYPLLMNTPVENQDELVALVRQVCSRLEVEEPRLPDLLAEGVAT